MYKVLIVCAFILILPSSTVFALTPFDNGNIPPTRAFDKIKTDDNSNVTAKNYSATVKFKGHDGISVLADYFNNIINFFFQPAQGGTNVFIPATVEDLTNVTDTGCVSGQWRIVNATGWYICGTSAGGGESNTASNIGTGVGIFDSKVGVDLRFNSLLAGSGITITDIGNEIRINSTASGSGNATFFNDLGDVVITSPAYRNIVGFNGLQWINKVFSINNQTAQKDFQIIGINNQTGVITTNQFSVNGITCPGSSKISSINNATGQVICSGGTPSNATVTTSTFIVYKSGVNTFLINGTNNSQITYNTDSATVIQYGLDNLPSGKGRITIKDGTYTITSPLKIGSELMILDGDMPTLQADGAVVSPLIKMKDTTQRSGIQISNLILKNTGASGSGTALDMSHFAASKSENIWITGNFKTGIAINASDSYYNTIENVRIGISGLGSTGILIDNGANENSVFRTRILTGANSTGVYVNAHGNDLYSVDVETGAQVGLDVGPLGNDLTVDGIYLEGNKINVRLAAGAEGTVFDGGVIIAATTANVQDNGAVKPVFSGTTIQYDQAFDMGGNDILRSGALKFNVTTIDPSASTTYIRGTSNVPERMLFNVPSGSEFDFQANHVLAAALSTSRLNLNNHDLVNVKTLQSGAADIADSGTGRFGNNEIMNWESSPTGDDIGFTVDTNNNFLFGTNASNIDANKHKIINLSNATLKNDAANARMLGLLGNLTYAAKCSDGQQLAYQSSNQTWICSTSITGGITSINGDNTPAQVFSGTSRNVTITDTGPGTLQWNLGDLVLVTNGNSQNITKSINFTANNKLTFFPPTTPSKASLNIGSPTNQPSSVIGGDMWLVNSGILRYRASSTTFQVGATGLAASWTAKQTFTPTSAISGLNIGTLASNPTSPRQGDLWVAGTTLKYNDNTNTTQSVTLNGLTAAITSINGDTTAAQNIIRQFGNTTVTNSTNTRTIGLGVNAVITGGSSQTITKGLTANSLTLGGAMNANNNVINSLGTPAASTDAARANTLQIGKSLAVGTCANGSPVEYQTSNSTWICGVDDGLTAAITSINSDTTAAQVFSGQSGNVTITDTGAGTLTFGFGTNPVIVGGSSQTVTKGLTLNALTLGGAANANSQVINSLGTPAASTDAQRVNRLGLKALVVGTCADGAPIEYQTSNSTFICGVDAGAGAAITSINGDTTAAQNIIRQFGNTTVTNSTNTRTIGLGVNAVITNGAAQKITKNMTLQNPQINGLDINYTSYAADHTADYTEDHIAMDVSAASRSLTLPTAVGHTGKVYTIQMAGLSAGNIVKIKTTSSQTIDNFVGTTSTINMTHVDEIVSIISNGANWDTTLGIDPSEPQDYFIRGSTTRWYGSAINAGLTSTSLSTVTVIRATPWVVSHTIQIDKIEFEIATAANPTTTQCRVGIYTDNGNIYPLKLLSATEFQSADTAAGVKTSGAFGSPLTITKGLYWMAWTCGTAATTQPTFRAIPVASVSPILGSVNTMGSNNLGTFYTVAFTYAALPATYPAGATVNAGNTVPQILVEINKG